MGIDHNIYLGPYAQCTFRVSTKKVEVKSCTNAKCPKSPKHPSHPQPDRFALDLARFCPTCGTEIGTCSLKEEIEPDPYEVIEDKLIKLSGEFDAEPFVHWLGPNLEKGPSRRFHLEESEPLHEDLTKVDQQAEIKWFEKKYAKELEALGEVYEKIEMRWGFHQYFK